MRKLWALDHALQSASKRLENTTGITSPQRLVVRIVGVYPDISAGELAEILVTHPSTLTGVLRRLEARGFLERRADPHDARRAHLRLTRKGRSVDTLRTGTIEQAVHRLLGRLDPAALASTERVVQALIDELTPHGH
jgi:DNA-binding MarR family transcriptional regulator